MLLSFDDWTVVVGTILVIIGGWWHMSSVGWNDTIMSANTEESESGGGVVGGCASCGVKEGDDNDVKLKDCSACHLVKYCGVNCQKKHRPKHKRACKKRAAELRDEILFKQPDSSHIGDCPICFLPIPVDEDKSAITTCCSKVICDGCNYANQMREAEEKRERKCAFCRTPIPKSKKEADALVKKRLEMNDPAAMSEEGIRRYRYGDYQSAIDYLSRAAELGDIVGHYQMGCMYYEGVCVERDMAKQVYHYEPAAIGGHPRARLNLGCIEFEKGRPERGIKHWIIAAKLGHDKSLSQVKMAYEDGLVSKDDFAAALRDTRLLWMQREVLIGRGQKNIFHGVD